ncbi:hypothetical protein Zm00014a_024890 [Zea mays]|uniref:Uncharacterized protein n=1 Tax=Zea mays TaxID=4577 RepID=A0A3L6DFM5_MAIZE|nr:hypothetical protein Zm00014a_024890 [Zea mays]
MDEYHPLSRSFHFYVIFVKKEKCSSSRHAVSFRSSRKPEKTSHVTCLVRAKKYSKPSLLILDVDVSCYVGAH